MKIPLFAKRGIKDWALIDDEDAERVLSRRWHRTIGCSTYYAASVDLSGKYPGSLALHRFIMNAPKGMDVDHINGNGLDNRKANLEIVTHAENVRRAWAAKKLKNKS